MGKVHGQWICNNLLRQFRPELDCYRLITKDDAKFFRMILAKRANRRGGKDE